MAEFEFDKVSYPLLLNGRALFRLYDLLGTDIIGALTQSESAPEISSAEYYEKLVGAAVVLMEQGELERRRNGGEKRDLPSAAVLSMDLTVLEVIALRGAVLEAVIEGFSREHEPRDPPDLDLLEINKKKDPNGVNT
jgi:hypothetical protein